MRTLVTISLLLFVYSCGNTAQQEQPQQKVEVVYSADDVKKVAYDYNAAMIAKDTATLNSLLHESLSYGHSNGWVETKEEQKANLFNGTITYYKVDQPELQVIMNGNIATVRGNGIFDVDYKEHEHLIFDLNVMQTWIFEDGRWQMLNRQSVANK